MQRALGSSDIGIEYERDVVITGKPCHISGEQNRKGFH